MRTLLLIAALGVAAELAAETVLFERYQPLVDRYPFGVPPEGFNPDKMSSEVSKSAAAEKSEVLTVEQAAIVQNITFSVINVDSDGVTMVGFTDNSDQKQPHHYYMRVGESRNGWTVKEADPAEKTMTVEKDGVEVALELGGNSSGKGGSAGKSAGRTPMPERSPLLAAGTGGATLGSFRSRRSRREREAAEDEARRKAAEEESRKIAEAEAIEREKERMAREEERAEQRRQLEAIRDELRRSRENRNANANEGEALD